MKRLTKLLGSLGAITMASVGLFVFSASPTLAFQNFTTNGSMTTGGSGGGSGSVGTLQQVLDAGNSATQNILLTGAVTSTYFVAAGTATNLQGFFVPNATLRGRYFCSTTTCFYGTESNHSMVLYTNNISRWTVDTSGNFVPSLTDGTLNIGSLTGRVMTGFFVNVTSTNVTSSNMFVQNWVTPYVSEGASLGLTGNRFGALYLDTRPAENAVNIITSSPYEIHFTGASGADVQSSQSSLKIGVASTFATQLYSNGAEGNPQLNLETNGRITMRPGVASVMTAEFNTTSTRFINSSSTFFLSGASAIISSVAPIPTSTSILAGTIPSQAYAFNASTTNCIYWTPGTLRGAWDATQIAPKVTWIPSATGTGDVVWRLAAMSLTDNTYIGAAFTGPYAFATTTVGNASFRQIDNMDNLTVQAAAANVPIRWEMCRIGGQAGDTYGADAYMEVVTGKYYATNQSD